MALIKAHAKDRKIEKLAKGLDLTVAALIIAFLAWRDADRNRSAARLARSVFRGEIALAIAEELKQILNFSD